MSYQEDLINSIYDRGEPGLAMSRRGDMAKEWYEGWKKDSGLPADSNALPPVDATPPWARPYLFPRAEAAPNEDMQIAKGFVKNVGEPIGVMSATQGMKIIDDTETNPLKKELRRIRMFKNNPIDPGLGGV